MKECPQCSNTYSDDMMFCLSDGTPLVPAADEPELETVVRPQPGRRPSTAAPRSGVNPLLVVLGIGAVLFFFLIVGALGLWLLWPSPAPDRTDDNSIGNANYNSSKVLITTPTPQSAADDNSDLSEEKEELERERQRLAEERRKLDEQKRRRDEPLSADPAPAAPQVSDPPMTRITFGRGSYGETVGGVIGRQRGFVLRTRGGQTLYARVSSKGNCVTFTNGSTSASFYTGAGDTYLYIRNNCSDAARFSLSVTVR